MNNENLIFDFLVKNISIESVLTFLVVYFFIIWIAILVWVIRDISNRTDSIFLQLFSVFTILFLTPFGIFIYLIIRPTKTLFEKYYEEVENNLDCLSQEVKKKIGDDNLEKLKCFNCDALVEKDFKYCPECKIKLKKKCKNCGKKLDLERKSCPYCGGNKKTDD